MSNDDLAKFTGLPPMGGFPGTPDKPERLVLGENPMHTYLRERMESPYRPLEDMIMPNGLLAARLSEQALKLERHLRESIENTVKAAQDMDIPEDHKEAISFHLFRKLDELSSAIDTVNEKIGSIRTVDLNAVIKRLCNED